MNTIKTTKKDNQEIKSETMDQLIEAFAGDMQCYGCGKTLTTRYTLERHYCLLCAPPADCELVIPGSV